MEVVMINVSQGEAVEEDRTSVWVIEPLHQVDDGGLATP